MFNGFHEIHRDHREEGRQIDAATGAPERAISQRTYNAVRARIDRWLKAGWATEEQRRALAAHLLDGMEQTEESA